jgi:hypothetical protein
MIGYRKEVRRLEARGYELLQKCDVLAKAEHGFWDLTVPRVLQLYGAQKLARLGGDDCNINLFLLERGFFQPKVRNIALELHFVTAQPTAEKEA